MSPKQNQPFIFGPGGLIPDLPQNQRLINLIKETKPLTPEQLLKLADFFQPNRTLTTTVDHLELIAAANSFPPPESEDIWSGFDEPGRDEKQEQFRNELLTRLRSIYTEKYSSTPLRKHAAYEIKCIPSLLPGLGLLIETSKGHDPYVIGVCPLSMANQIPSSS